MVEQLSNSLQGKTTKGRSFTRGVVVICVETGRDNGEFVHFVTLRRAGVITFRRWRKSANQAADLFEAVVERFVDGKELGTL